MTVNEKMTALANEIRELSGTTTPKSIDTMTNDVNNANEEVTVQADLITQIQTVLEGKSGGATLPTLTMPAAAEDILSGKEAIDGSGKKITGTIPTVEQATPIVTVDANGFIVAIATQAGGYVISNARTGTKQLSTQPAKTITPGTSGQTAVAKGLYTTGVVTVEGDSNLVPANIKNGVTIFGVTGTASGEGDGDGEGADELFEKVLNRGFTEAIHSTATSVGSCAFALCMKLSIISFPEATTIGTSAFMNCSNISLVDLPKANWVLGQAFMRCSKLTTVNLPVATSLGTQVFGYCSSLASVNIPLVKSIEGYAFVGCSSLSTVEFSQAQHIGSTAFSGCRTLKSLYLTGSSVCKLSNSNAFTSTPIGGYSNYTGTYGSIYVPASLLTSYQTATNWTYFSSRFVGI